MPACTSRIHHLLVIVEPILVRTLPRIYLIRELIAGRMMQIRNLLTGRSGGDDHQWDIGVIGTGWISRIYHLPILSTYERTNVSYIADIDVSEAKRFARIYGATPVDANDRPSSFPPCDIVLLAIPVGARYEYIKEFSERGTPILAEKPFALNEEFHRRILELTDDISCNYQRVFYSPVRQTRSVLASGLFGELETVQFYEGSVQSAGIPQSSYRVDPVLSGGNVLMEFGPHTLSQLVYIFDGWDISVKDAEMVWNDEFEVDVDATINVRNGEQHIDIDYKLSDIKPVGKIARFVFDRAEVQFSTMHADVPLSVTPHGSAETTPLTIEPADEWATTQHQGIYLQWSQFIDALENGSENDSIQTAPIISRLIDGMYEQGRESEVKSR